MNRHNALRLLAVLTLELSAWKVSGGAFQLADQDAFATARGEAFVATADNASAIFYNPAGVAQLEGFNYRGGIYGIYLDPTFTPPPPANTNTFHIDNKLSAVPQAFLTFTPNQSAIAFGLGIYAPYGLSLAWPQNTGFRSVGIEGALTYITINPVVAVKLAPNFSLGGGLMVNYGNIDLKQGILPNRTPFTNVFHFTGDGWAVGYNLGVLWQPYEKISVGATFRSSATMSLNGHSDVQLDPIIPRAQVPAQSEFKFPLTTALGISYRPTPKWNAEFDASFTDWASVKSTTINQQGTLPPGVPRTAIVPLNWESSWMFSLGATRYLDKGWHVSAGYLFFQNSVPDATYTPLVPDMNRHFFSVGTGLKGKYIDFDVAYQFGYGTRSVTGFTPTPGTPPFTTGQTPNGDYKYISQAVMVTVGLHF